MVRNSENLTKLIFVADPGMRVSECVCVMLSGRQQRFFPIPLFSSLVSFLSFSFLYSQKSEEKKKRNWPVKVCLIVHCVLVLLSVCLSVGMYVCTNVCTGEKRKKKISSKFRQLHERTDRWTDRQTVREIGGG